MSGSGRGASGRSKSSRPRSSRNVRSRGRSRSRTSRKPRQPRPGGDVGDGRRPEGAEVAEDDLVDRRIPRQRAAEPRLRGRRDRLHRPAPDAARRDLHERKQVPARLGESGGVVLREPLGERRAELGAGARPLGEERARVLDDGVEVDAHEVGSVRAVAAKLPREHRLRQRPEEQAVVGRDEVDRPAHEVHPHDLALLEQPAELVRPEALEARPERRVRVQRLLRLHADEVVDGVERRELRAAQQQLPLEGRAVEGAVAEDVGAHARRATIGDPLPCTGLERCPSGLRSATGNRVRAERCVAGSNPALSA